MSSLRLASFNIEKNGKSSLPEKRSKVSTFVDRCCSGRDVGADVIFLCEVHSARQQDYVDFLREIYGVDFLVSFTPGGMSNGNIVLYRRSLNATPLTYPLKGLNRSIVLLHTGQLFIGLAHFKSGRTGLTKDQLQELSASLQQMSAPPQGRWAITGDMNWDYNDANELTLPAGAQDFTCWNDQTQVKGGILDWLLTGGEVEVEPLDVRDLFVPEMNDMQGPDHRPVIFDLEWEN